MFITFAGFRFLRGRIWKACGTRDVCVLRAADYYLETGDQSYWKTLNTLWNELVTAQCM